MSGIARAQALLAAHRPEDALTELATLPAAESISGPAALLRCYALMRLEWWPEAGVAARAGLAENGPDPDLLYVLGRAEHEAGHLEVAERALLDGLAMAPHDVDLLCAYAQLCAADNQPDKAQKLVALALAEEPESATVFATRIQVAHARDDDRAAQRIAQQFVAAHPENPAAHALLGGISAVRGQVGPAYAGLRQAAASAPAEHAYAESAMELRIAKHPLMLPPPWLWLSSSVSRSLTSSRCSCSRSRSVTSSFSSGGMCPGFRGIAHDRRGHGRSSQTWDGNDMDTYAADLAALVDPLGLRDVILVGHSTGGGEVVRYAARYGAGNVARLVTAGAVPPVIVKSDTNPDGLPLEVFDGLRAGVLADRSQ
jgi:tetratricopeptide (TPR) repeat protein